MKNTFLIDLKYSGQYEVCFALLLDMQRVISHGDDKGIDLINEDGSVRVDVKAYRSPKVVKHFQGFYIETEQKSGNPGWINDETKETTHYLLVQDCDEENGTYYMAYLISRENLKKAIEECDKNGTLQNKEYETTFGVIVPYDIVDKYSDKKIQGVKWHEEHKKRYEKIIGQKSVRSR